MPIEKGRGPIASNADLHQGFRVFRFVIEHPVLFDNFRRQQLLQLRLRIGSMRAQSIEERDSLRWNEGEVLEEPWNQSAIWGCPGDIGKNDTNPRVRLNRFSERRRAHWPIHRGHYRGVFIRQTRQVGWLNHRDIAIRQIQWHVPLSIGKLNPHQQIARLWFRTSAQRVQLTAPPPGSRASAKFRSTRAVDVALFKV